MLDSMAHDILARRFQEHMEWFPCFAFHLEKLPLMHAAKKRRACGVRTFIKHDSPRTSLTFSSGTLHDAREWPKRERFRRVKSSNVSDNSVDKTFRNAGRVPKLEYSAEGPSGWTTKISMDQHSQNCNYHAQDSESHSSVPEYSSS